MVRVKICGMTNLEDTLLAVEAGADAIGFILYKKSKRYVTGRVVKEIIASLPPFIETVGVFVNETVEKVNRVAESCNLGTVQLHGDETPAYCKKIRKRVIKSVQVKNLQSFSRLSSYKVSGFLLDSHSDSQRGGTGQTFDWNLVHRGKKYGPVILAGGLNPGNVCQAIRQVKPFGVDVCSGVEKSPGLKDHDKVRAFIESVKKM